MAGHVVRMEEGRSTFKILTSRPRGKSPLGMPAHIWEYNIRIYVKEIDVNKRNLIDSAQENNA